MKNPFEAKMACYNDPGTQPKFYEDQKGTCGKSKGKGKGKGKKGKKGPKYENWAIN